MELSAHYNNVIHRQCKCRHVWVINIIEVTYNHLPLDYICVIVMS